MRPRDYQLDLIDRAQGRFRAGFRRVLLQAPVGSGKTVVSSEIIRRAVGRGRRVLFTAHLRRLVFQKSRKLAEFGVGHGVIMNGVSSRPGCPVQVASRDTLLSRSLRRGVLALPPADLVIEDECHRVLGGKYLSLLEAYPDAWHVGLTATPARADGKGLGRFYEAMECGASVADLIRGGHLVGVDCFAPQNYGRKSVSARKLAGDPVASWRRDGRDLPTVLFAAKVKASRALCDRFNEAGVPAEHIDGHTPDGEREAVFDRSRTGRTKVICSVGTMTEGIDLPWLGCCILFRLAASYGAFIQMVGRVMRPSPGKDRAVLIDHSDAVLEHGFPDEDVRWELDPEDAVEGRNRADREEGKRKKVIACPRCGCLFSGSLVCPECQFRIVPKPESPHSKNQLLTAVERESRLTEEARTAARVSYWHTCLRVAAAKGMKASQASSMYRRKYGVWPEPDLPNAVSFRDRDRKVAELFPQYLKGVKS